MTEEEFKVFNELWHAAADVQTRVDLGTPCGPEPLARLYQALDESRNFLQAHQMEPTL